MDYEKKYKEALELARVAAFNGHQSLMEGIFPELAEPEDEKTRKRIIALVNAHGQGMYKDDMLAWLENIPYTIDHEKREGFHLGYKAGLEKQGEQKSAIEMKSAEESLGIDSETYNKIVDECIYGDDKQKPSWSEEDEIVDEIIDFLDEYIGSVKPPSLSHPVKSKWCNWLKSLKQRIAP